MVTTGHGSSPARSSSERRRRRSLGVLAGVELCNWGVLYYAFPVAAPHIAQETGWSATALATVYSACLVTSALAGVRLGRVVDRATSLRRVMPLCSAVGYAGILVSTTGRPVLFVVGWVLVGVAQAGCLWVPAFIAVTRWYRGRDSTWPMTVITAVGGSASFVFAPVVARLCESLGWSRAFATLAIGAALLTLPAQLLGLRARWQVDEHERQVPRRALRSTTRQPRFLVLQLCMLISGVALFSITLNLVPLAEEKGASYTQAAMVFGLVGLGQVVGRVVYAMAPRSRSPKRETIGLLAGTGAALAAVAVVPTVGAVGVAALGAGVVRGNHTLLMRTGVLDRWGTQNFGAVMAWFNLPVALGIAVSPAIGVAAANLLGSYSAASVLVAVVACLGALAARRT